MNLERKIMLVLLVVFGCLALFLTLFVVAQALEIDSCTTFYLFNLTSNSSYPMEICPKSSNLTLTNLTWGYAANGTIGTCNYNISVQNSSDLLPKRTFNGSLPSNGSYFFEDAFVKIDIKSESFYCPICAVPKKCSTNITDFPLTNESYDWKVIDDECDVTVKVPAKPYCLSEDVGYTLNNTCVSKEHYKTLFSDARQLSSCNASLAVYQATWLPPQSICRLPPKVLAEGWNVLDAWQREKLSVFAGLNGAGKITVQQFLDMTTPGKSDTLDESNRAFFALDTYRTVGFGDYFKEMVRGADGNYTEKVTGYVSLYQPACLNQTAPLLAYGKESYGNGQWSGIILAGLVVLFLLCLFLYIVDLNNSM